MPRLKNYATAFGVLLTLAFAAARDARAQQFTDWSPPVNLGAGVNTPAVEGCPFISKDGLSLYFASTRPGGQGGQDIYVAERASPDAPWGTPRNLGPAVNGAGNEVCPMLTTDGHQLYFVSDRAGGCGGQDLYVSRRRNARDNLGWEEPSNLGCQLNSPQNDFTPSLFEDEDGSVTLYFSSSRPGGPGGVDIYASRLGADGEFGPAAPVEGLNTAANDQRPNIRVRDGLEIFFESNRPGTLGNTDLYVSTRANTSSPWAAPVNLGAAVNSPSTEGRPSLSFDATALYFMSNRPGGAGDLDLYVTTRRKVRGRIESEQAFVRQHYFDFLGRAPDDGGWAFWTGQILRCADDAACVERKRVDVSRAFFYSAEFITKDPRLADELRGTRGYNEAFVEQCYRTYLQRAPDAEGFQFWAAKLNGRLPRVTDADYSEMIRAFLLSEEYRRRTGL